MIRLLIKTIARQVLRIKSWIYESARNLFRGRRAVPLQTFTTRHSNRKLSIVMALSTTFTQYAPEITKVGKKITQNKGHFAVQGHSRSPILVPIESSYTTSYYWLIRTYLLFCTISGIQHSKCEQELIRRWDSERELLYDDIAHVLQNDEKENLLRLTN